jgi:hypothetical protein
VNLPNVTSKLAIIRQAKIQVKDTSDRNGDTKTWGCIPLVPSLLREVHLRWRGVVPQRPPTPQRLTLFSDEQATKASSRSTKRCPWRWHETFTQSIGASSTTQLEAPNKPTKVLHTKIEKGGRLLPARIPYRDRQLVPYRPDSPSHITTTVQRSPTRRPWYGPISAKTAVSAHQRGRTVFHHFLFIFFQNLHLL